MIFIPTCAQDGTTDILLPFLEREAEIFRFDIDRFQSYSWDVSGSGFVVRDSSGKEITEKTLSCHYLRKPMFIADIDVPKGGSLENWTREEITDWVHDLYSQCALAGLCALVHPGNGAWRKPRQMRLAARFFPVPEWHLFQGALPNLSAGKTWVVKTLTQTKIGDDKFLFVRQVEPDKLAPTYPWFVQEAIPGGLDVTVVYVARRLFAWASPREPGSHFDSRRNYVEAHSAWTPIDLSTREQDAIRAFMAEAGLSFGRFDFIRKDGVLYFLELNANGQWAWLDEANERGLVSAVADEILAVERSGRTLAETWSE